MACDLLYTIDNPQELTEFLSTITSNDEATKKRGEVFTPYWFIDEMLDKLQSYVLAKCGMDIFSNPDLTWFDPAAGIGNFQVNLYYRYMDGLKDKMPISKDRREHIISNMLDMSEINPLNHSMIKKIFKNHKGLNLNLGNSLELDVSKTFGIDSFDFIIGNPPYNKEFDKNGGGASPIYNEFIELYIDKCKMMSFVIPQRWMTGGKGLDKFKKMMKKRQDMVYFETRDRAKDVFRNIKDIKGGIMYFLKDSAHKGACLYDGLSLDLSTGNDIHKPCIERDRLIEVLLEEPKLTNINMGRCYTNIETNTVKDNPGDVKCYVSSKQSDRLYEYVDKSLINKPYLYDKVITPRAAHKGNSCFGNIIVAEKESVHSTTYLHFRVDSSRAAISLWSYLNNCKLPNFLLSIMKRTQDISNKSLSLIPLPPLDRVWTDEEVYQYYKFDNNLIEYLNSLKVIGFNPDPNNKILEELKPREKLRFKSRTK